jgi:L-ascorbate metabolism protein UlaG (beta-lactamase superfamily)
MEHDRLLEITYLGQAGALIDWKGGRFLIDPYLSNYVVDGGIGSAELFARAFPPPMNPEQIEHVDGLFITHDHADHCDPNTVLPLLQINPEMKIVCPKPAADHLRTLGVSEKNLLVPGMGEVIELAGLQFYCVAAAHYEFEADTNGNYSYFGYVIHVGETWIYHAGDTILYDGMAEQILAHTSAIQLGFLPVNGRDGWRERLGMIGNLDAAEALGLARQIKCDVLIPIHNDLFKVNHVNQAVLADLLDHNAPRQKVHWLQPGEKFYYQA